MGCRPLIGKVKDFLKLKGYLGGDSGDVGTTSNGEVAIGVGGEGDSEDDVEFKKTPTGRISWIDLRS